MPRVCVEGEDGERGFGLEAVRGSLKREMGFCFPRFSAGRSNFQPLPYKEALRGSAPSEL